MQSACDLVSVALRERLSDVLELLPAASRGRANEARQAFGPSGWTPTTDPKQSWKMQQQQAAARAAGGAPAAANGRAAPGGGAPGGGAPGASAAGPVGVSAADVLHVLDGERQASRSRVVQWWRCNDAPLEAYAQQSARLFAPPAAQESGKAPDK